MEGVVRTPDAGVDGREGASASLPEVAGYRLLERLGAGGMGIVYRALNQRTGREVAVKLLRSDTDSVLATRRFKREFRAAARIRHPHAASVFELHLGEPSCYSMELVCGSPLDRYVAGNDPALRFARLRAALGQVLVALDVVHRAGLIHRDLKPANVLVAELAPGVDLGFDPPGMARRYYEPLPDGSRPLVKLVDFGLAWGAGTEQSGELTKTGAIVGTVEYISPEQVLGGILDARADLYSLGVLLFELLAGRPPFTAPDTVSLLLKHAYEAPPPPSLFANDVDPLLDAFTLRLMAKDPADRYPTARDALIALERTAPDETDPRTSASTAGLQLAPRAHGLLSPRLVGREPELHQIREAIGDARAGAARTILVTGEAGIGKSRLIEEIQKTARMRGLAVLTGIAHDEQGYAFAPFLPIVDGLARECALLPPERSVHDAAATLARFVPRWRELVPAGHPVTAARSAEEELYQVLAAVSEVLQRVMQTRGVALILEDAQWADPASLELFAYLLRSAEAAKGAPLVLVTSLREDEVEAGSAVARWRDALVRSTTLLRIRPGRLALADLAEMAGSMLGVETVPEAVLRWLQRESQGIPFIAAELLAYFAGDRATGGGRLGVDLPRSVSGEYAFPSQLPPSVLELVRRRLAKLEPDERKVAAAAAVVGPVVPFDLLMAASGMEEDGLLDALQALIRHRILVESREDADLFLFPSKAVRDALTAELVLRRKRRAHERVANALEARCERRPEDVVSLAHHWLRASRPAEALPHLVAAVHFHRRRLDHAEALATAREALEILEHEGDPGTRLAMMVAAGELEAALCAYERAAALFGAVAGRSSTPADLHGAALLGLADLGLRRGDYEEAESGARTALELAESVGAVEIKGRAHVLLGRIAWHRGTPGDALEAFRCALGEERARGNLAGEATALNNIGYAHFARGEFADADRFFDEALSLARARGNLPAVARSLEAKASVAQRRGTYSAGADALAEARGIMHRLGDRRGEAYCIVSEGNLHAFGAAWTEALTSYDDAEGCFFELGEMRGIAFCAGNRGSVLTSVGAYREALESLGQALRLARKISERGEVAFALYALAELWRDLADVAAAGRHDAQALAIFRAQGDRYGLGLVLAGAARTADLAEDRGLARRQAGEALIHAIEAGMPEVEVRAKMVLARLDRDLPLAAAAAELASRIGLVELRGLARALEADLADLAGHADRARDARSEAAALAEGAAATLEEHRPRYLARAAARGLFAAHLVG